MRARILSLIILMALLSASLIPLSINTQPDEIVLDESFNASSLPETSMSKIIFSTFVQNAGQINNPDVLFYSANGNLAFTNSSLFVYSQNPDNSADADEIPQTSVVSFSFMGADAVPEGLNPTSWTSSYFLGNDSDKWQSGVQNFQGLVYRDLWEGIDLEYRMDGSHLKYQFIVHPGADPSDIAIEVDGHDNIYISENQELCVDTGIGNSIVDSGLDVFYADDSDSKIDARFILDNDMYSFEIGAWDNARTLIIDPLVYSTYLGGPGADGENDISVDKEGSAYVTGQTDSLNFITIPGIIEDNTRASTDLFVAKLDNAGTGLFYSAFIGGMEYETGTGIEVDSLGQAHITGITYSKDFPSTTGAFDETYNGVGDAFIIKINHNGDNLNYSTFLGGAHDDMANAIALDENGQAYITGETWSSDFPVSGNAINSTLNGDSDIFVAKMNAIGDILEYSTFLGGTGSEQGMDIVVDSEKNMFMTGATRSGNFPVTGDKIYLEGENAFVLKLNKSGNSVDYSRLVGGSGDEGAMGITLDNGGNAYITGRTNSANFQTTKESYDNTYNGCNDAFLTKISSAGDSVLYSTYLGGSMDDQATGISLEANGSVYIIGFSSSSDLPTTWDAFSRTLNGEQDGFIARMGVDSSLFYSSFLGGEGPDLPRAIEISNDGCAFITGDTTSDDFPTTDDSYSALSNGRQDGFVTKMDIIVPVANAGIDIYVNESNDAIFDGTGSYDNAGIVNYTWTFNDGFQDMTLYDPAPMHFFKTPGTYRINLRVRDQAGNKDTDAMYLRVLPYPYPVANAGQDMLVNQSNIMNFNGSASRDNRGIVSYRWTFNDGINDICLLGESPAWTFTVPGTYIVVLNVTDAQLNWNTDTMNVTVADATRPIAVIHADNSIIQGEAANFDASGSADNVGINNYTWTLKHNDTNVTLYGANQSFRFWAPGNYTVTLNVTDGLGNSAFNIASVTVVEPEIVVEKGLGDYFNEILLICSILFLILAMAIGFRRPLPPNQEVEE